LPTCQHICTHAPKTRIAALPSPIHSDQARLKSLLRICIQKSYLLLISEFEQLIPTIEVEQLGGIANSNRPPQATEAKIEKTPAETKVSV
jgi:hypothetical protein